MAHPALSAWAAQRAVGIRTGMYPALFWLVHPYMLKRDVGDENEGGKQDYLIHKAGSFRVVACPQVAFLSLYYNQFLVLRL